MNEPHKIHNFGNWQFDVRNGELIAQSGRRAALKPTECQVLDFLVEHKENFYSAYQIIDAVRGPDVFVQPNVVEQCITSIRKQLTSLGIGLNGKKVIETKKGKGWRFTVAPINPAKPSRNLLALSKRRALYVGLAVLVVLGTLIFGLFRWGWKPHRETVSGSGLPPGSVPLRPKILVLEFASRDPAHYQMGKMIATMLKEAKGQEDIEIVGLERTVKASGDAGTEEADRLGREQGATAVIWGYVGTSDEAPVYVSFEPVIYSDNVGLPLQSEILFSVPRQRLEGMQIKIDLSAKLTPLVMMAVAWYRLGHSDLVGFETAIERAMETNPEKNQLLPPAYVYFYRSFADVMRLDFGATIKDFDFVLRNSPTPRLAALALANKSYYSAATQDYRQAAEGCRELLATNTNDLDALRLCAEAELAIGDNAAVQSFTERVFQHHSASVSDFLDRAYIHLDFCQFSEANADLDAARRLNPTDPGVTLLAETIKAHSPPTDQQPSTPSKQSAADLAIMLLTALPYARAGQRDLAISQLKSVIDRKPSTAAYTALASTYAEASDFPNAIANLTAAIKLQPSSPFLYLARSLLLEGQDNLQAAYEDIQAAIRLDPMMPQARLEAGSILFALHQSSKARSELHKALSLQPTYAEAYFTLAQGAIDEQDWQSAYLNYSKAIASSSQTPAPFGSPTFRSVGDCPPNDGAARRITNTRYLQGRVMASLVLHRYASAEKDIEAAKALTPNDSFNYSLISQWEAKSRKDYAHALEDIDRAIELDNKNPENYSWKAELLLDMNRPAEALPLLQKARQLNGNLQLIQNLENDPRIASVAK
jgi:tetratricopeptide (TPR) repeat protein/DNA-binding winged helix-turn-helix (wHTH) protein